jgi:hypothetical protein
MVELHVAIIFEVMYQRVRRFGDSRTRETFGRFVGTLINPERFAEPQKADAGASAGNLNGGESPSGREPSRAEKPQ